MKRILPFICLLLWLPIAGAQQTKTFVFVKVNESIMPIDRGAKYEDPLDIELKKERMGGVTGGGSSLSKEGKIMWVGLDVELTNIEKGIPFLKATLIRLGAPKTSTLEYQLQGKRVEVSLGE